MNARVLLVLCALLALVPPAGAAERGKNLLANAGFEAAGGWEPVGDGFSLDSRVAHSGRQSLRCVGAALDSFHGARQVITLDPPVKHPFRVSGWSRAEGAEVGQDYDLYLDLHYDDGTPLWGKIASCRPGTHAWERSELVFDVAKPVKSIEVFLLFRKAKGTVWFDDVGVSLAPFAVQGLRLLPGLFGGGSLGVTATTTLPAKWEATIERPAGVVARAAGAHSPIRLMAADLPAGKQPLRLRLSATDDLLGETVREERAVSLPAGPARRGYAAWAESSMRRVMPQALPSGVAAAPEARIALAGGEYESFQVVLLPAPGHDLRGVRVEPGDLVCRRTGARIPARQLSWQQVGYVRIEKPSHHPEVTDAAPGWWPDPLLPVERFDVPAGFAQPVWVTLYAPPGTPAGDYAGSLVVRPENEPAVRVGVRARVYGFSLPAEGHLKTAFALMDGFLEKVYGRPLDPAIRRRYGDFVLQHRLNPDDISRTEPPPIADLEHYNARGLNAFNVLNMVEERGNREWVCFSPPEWYTPANKQHLVERLDPYVAELRRAGLARKAYIYTFDERDKEFDPIMREFFGMVKERYPEIHTLTTAHVPQDPKALAELNIDWLCPVTSAYHFEEAERCRAAGRQVWSYICLGPRYPYANWLADDPLVEARVIWWQAYQQKLDGFLYWGLNIWGSPHNDRPIDPARGPLLDWSITTGGEYDWLHGDGRLLYAGKDGPIGSIRLDNIRDGLEDYEYLWLLARKAGGVEAGRRACLPVTQGLTQFTRDPEVVYRTREAVAKRVEGR